VDFVVNIALTAQGARGRLERETERGTVAIREVEDASCERVADVVALNLSLALDPNPAAAPPGKASSESSVPSEATAAPKATAAPEAAPAPESTDQQGSATPSAAVAQGEADSRSDVAEGAGVARWRVGVQGGMLTGLGSGLMGRGTAFVELRGAFRPILPEMTLRAAAVGTWGSAKTSQGVVRQSVWAGRLDVCPLAFGGATLSARPCAAGELGQIRAHGAFSDSTLWAALGVHARGQWVFSGPFALEGELGALFPLSKYQVAAGSTVLLESAPVAFSFVLGLSVGF
jgi:hypothetical protein